MRTLMTINSLRSALEARADYIVSGSDRLLELKEHQGIKILKPAEFLMHRIGPAALTEKCHESAVKEVLCIGN